jgi:hypothetical protein
VSAVGVEAPVGEVRVAGGEGGEIAVVVELRCDDDHRRCREAAGRVRLDAETRDGRLQIAVADWPRHGDSGLELEMELRLPRRLALALKVGVGEIHAEDLTGDLDLELGVGECYLSLAEAAVKAVKVAVGVGEATLSVQRHEIEGSGFLGRSIDWRGGSGTARVAVDCGVGEVEVELE